jgi:hypothetical protein
MDTLPPRRLFYGQEQCRWLPVKMIATQTAASYERRLMTGASQKRQERHAKLARHAIVLLAHVRGEWLQPPTPLLSACSTLCRDRCCTSHSLLQSRHDTRRDERPAHRTVTPLHPNYQTCRIIYEKLKAERGNASDRTLFLSNCKPQHGIEVDDRLGTNASYPMSTSARSSLAQLVAHSTSKAAYYTFFSLLSFSRPLASPFPI